MRFVLELDWVSIAASIVAFLALMASLFSAVGASRSADVAIQAERRMVAGERAAAIRELVRTAGKIEAQGKLVLLALEDASRSALATSEMHAAFDGKMPFIQAHNELHQRIEVVTSRLQHGIDLKALVLGNDEITGQQLELDQILGFLEGETIWALKRAEQLTYANRKTGDDIVAAERAENIFVRRNHEGKLY